MLHYRGLEAIYREAPTNRYYRPSIEVEEGKATVQIPVKEDFFHAAGAVHGSVYFKALDDAAFFAANSLVEDVFVLTANFQLYFLRPIQAGSIRAIGQVKSQTSRLVIADAMAFDDEGNEIARGSGSFMKSRHRLDALESYSQTFA